MGRNTRKVQRVGKLTGKMRRSPAPRTTGNSPGKPSRGATGLEPATFCVTGRRSRLRFNGQTRVDHQFMAPTSTGQGNRAGLGRSSIHAHIYKDALRSGAGED